MKATHRGHCQACGRLQKLPGGVLSTHGYTVAHGYFSGICKGTGYAPYQVSTDQIALYIKQADAAFTGVLDQIDALRSGKTEAGKAWISDYSGATGYVWRLVEIKEVVNQNPDGYSWVSFSYEPLEKRTWNGKLDNMPMKTLPEVIQHLNNKYARFLERTEAVSLRNYINWQTRRLNDWTPNQPLFPVAGKLDKAVANAGFKPVKE